MHAKLVLVSAARVGSTRCVAMSVPKLVAECICWSDAADGLHRVTSLAAAAGAVLRQTDGWMSPMDVNAELQGLLPLAAGAPTVPP